VDNNGNESDKTSDVSAMPHDTDGSYSLSFDGVDDYVEINAVADDMAGLTDWAFSVWVKPEKASFPGAIVYMLAINCDDGSSNCNKIMFGIHRDNGNIFIWAGSPGDDYGSYVLEGSATSDGAWNHIVYYRTGSTGTLYLNGTSQGTHTPTHDAFVASDKWSLGQEFDSGNTVTDEFFGLMDELAVWNEAITATEITALYNYGEPLSASSNSGNYTSSANLKGYWRFNENSSTTAYDLSGYGNHGTINGATYYSQGADAFAPSGSGTSGDPYLITGLDDLSWLTRHSSKWDKYYRQTANIDATETQYWDDADDDSDGDKYNDIYDGTSTGNNEGFSPIGGTFQNRLDFIDGP